jgi:hypothetical protein
LIKKNKRAMAQIVKIIIVLVLIVTIVGSSGCSERNEVTTSSQLPLPASTPVSDIINVKLFIPYAPVLNQPADVTCTVTSIYDFSDITVKITTRRRVMAAYDADIEYPYIIGDNISKTLNLKANQPVSFSSKIVIKETGFWRITAYIGYAPSHQYWSDKADIYVTVNTDNGTMGWSFPEPPIRPEVPRDIEIPATSPL